MPVAAKIVGLILHLLSRMEGLLCKPGIYLYLFIKFIALLSPLSEEFHELSRWP